MMDNIKKFAKLMKKKIRMLFIASKRNDISFIAKLVIVIVVGYALSPIDLIPDFIPVLGYLDDIIILPLGIALAIKLIPQNVIEECEKIAEEEENLAIPKSKVAAVIVVLIWILLVILIANKAFSIF
ncbi:MAG: DUF1232 domain-containing protein [Clostridia bacterium]|nr:DUF1232 domain-containing protein [Clostridia bacterium]